MEQAEKQEENQKKENQKKEPDIWNWTEHAVEMIPFGLLAGFYGEKEIRIIKISEEGFCFRMAVEITALQEKLRICFYDMQQDQYQEIMVLPDAWKLEERNEFYCSYAVAVRQENYCHAVQMLFGQYDRYIRLKLEEDDSLLAEQMTGYPAENDRLFADSLEEQMQEWFVEEQRLKADGKRKFAEVNLWSEGQSARQSCHLREQAIEWAIELDHPALYDNFLKWNLEQFLSHDSEENGAWNMLFQKKKPDRIYIGNTFCPFLFPEERILFSMMEKARREGLQMTLTFSYVRENLLKETEQLIEKLKAWCVTHGTDLEVVVNDWAMADMLKGRTGCLKPCLGILLNKRKKDPRMSYKKGKTRLLNQNHLNAEFYREYLKEEFQIYRFEWESCGYEAEFPKETGNHAVENHLHLPFYQTNTSHYCTLYAGWKWGGRGRQTELEACEKPCQELAYLYPKHLHMMGRYNSLFGLDAEILEKTGAAEGDWKKAAEYCRERHIGRLVFPCWMR